MTTLEAGRVIAERIKLERQLGEGGMGSVWIAEHLALGTRVAVKFIGADLLEKNPELRERFAREAGIAAKITSPHVVRTFDFGKLEDGTPYLVMELLDGESLWDRMQRERPLAPAHVVDIVRQTAKALDDAHLHGVVHRDIKPGNVFLTRSGRDLFVKVLDFGIAKDVAAHTGDSSTKTGVTLGTPAYMSPEQLVSTKGVDLQADLWALAVTAYEALLGRQPFQGETVPSLIIAIHSSTFALPSTVDGPAIPNVEALDTFFARAFAAKPKERFATALDLADALAAAIDGKAWAPRSVEGSGASADRTAYGAPMQPDAPKRGTGTDPGSPPRGTGTDPGGPASDDAFARTEASQPDIGARAEPGSPHVIAAPTKGAGAPAGKRDDAPGAAPTSSRPAWVVPAALAAVAAVAVGIWFATRPPAAPGAPDAGSAASTPQVSFSPARVASAPPPVASSGSARSSEQVGPIGPGSFRFGPNGIDVSTTSYRVKLLGEPRASLGDAFTACSAETMVPCSEPLWEKACAAMPDLAERSTWTSTIEGTRAVSRGGKGCAAREASPRAGEARAVACCTDAIATRDSASDLHVPRLLGYLQGMNAQDNGPLSTYYAPHVTFLGKDVSREHLLKSGDAWFKAHPDQRYVFGLCALAEDGASWTAACPTVIWRGGKIHTLLERLVWDGSDHLTSVDELDVRTLE